ncbi:hypothetical protein MKW92_051272 [Papaver armeniacum]|nr:hypothetical protein MKW92_051272 [Papaver armeniacum]
MKHIISVNDTDEKKNFCLDPTMEAVIAAENQIALETEGRLGDGLVFLKQGAVNTLPIHVIEVDSEDGKDITATHPSSVEVKELPHVSTDQALIAIQRKL